MNESKHICISPYVANDSEAHVSAIVNSYVP